MVGDSPTAQVNHSPALLRLFMNDGWSGEVLNVDLQILLDLIFVFEMLHECKNNKL